MFQLTGFANDDQVVVRAITVEEARLISIILDENYFVRKGDEPATGGKAAPFHGKSTNERTAPKVTGV